MKHDLIIRDGYIMDGTGAAPFKGDVAIRSGRIVGMGHVLGSGTREIDAKDLLVTPGFIDLHTHYDGQAIWSDRLTPSSNHGVTTVVIGNCGVGFAPCKPQDHDTLIDVMAGVEDIPGIVMVDGLPWTWETFPQYLDALDARPRDIDLATFLPHSPLRVYVMGERGARRESATSADLQRMKELAREAIQVGAIGFASSRLMIHRTGTGNLIPSYDVMETEIAAIADGLVEAGGGLLQFVPDVPVPGYEKVLSPFFRIAREKALPLTFSLATGNADPPVYQAALDLMEQSNRAGAAITAQIFPRPIGMIIGLELTAHPFVSCPTYKAISHLPLSARIAEMHKPDVRRAIINEIPELGHPLTQMARNWAWIFPMGDNPNYEPDAAQSLKALAAAHGVREEEEAYDRLLDDGGHAMMLLAIANYQYNSLDTIGSLIGRQDILVALGDGGAHYGMICDASYPTFMLTHWGRDRDHGRFSVSDIIHQLTARPAEVAGLKDRGRIALGYKADINIIDHEKLKLHKPIIVRDLPGGGRRLHQDADGYVATIVSGQIISENGIPTSARPGRLIRGRQAVPTSAGI